MILELHYISKTFIQGDTTMDALKEVSLKIKKNSLNIITGPSGSGKSTLISVASLMAVPTHGEIIINGIHASKLPEPDKSLMRRKDIGIIYQRDNLFRFLNVLENVTVPQLSENKETAGDILNKIGLDELNIYPDEISLFDQQKTALARALVNNPSIILADEPTSELNTDETVSYINLLMDFTDKCAVLMVSNNPDLEEYFDNTFSLSEGILKTK